MVARVVGLLLVLVLLPGCAMSPPAPVVVLTSAEQVRQARCAERGGSFEFLDGRWHCLAR